LLAAPNSEMTIKIINIILLKYQFPHHCSFAEFGDDSIEKLAKHFAAPLTNAGVDVEFLVMDWTALKTILYKRCYIFHNSDKTIMNK